jgi:hypothetical protein
MGALTLTVACGIEAMNVEMRVQAGPFLLPCVFNILLLYAPR